MSRLPPQLRRCRTVLPEEAGTGATPQRQAKDASPLSLSGLFPMATSREAAVSVPTSLSEAGVGTVSGTNRAICFSSSATSSESRWWRRATDLISSLVAARRSILEAARAKARGGGDQLGRRKATQCL